MKLLFDATELSYFNENSGHRAGVFYVALNILREFRRQNIDITFCCDFRRYYFFKNIDEFKDIPLLQEHSPLNKFFGWLIYISDNLPLRIKYFLLILTRLYDCYLYRINKKNFNQLRNFDLYFSPFTPPSKEIQSANIKRFRIIHDVIPLIENDKKMNPQSWYYKIYNTINSEDYYFTNSEYTRADVLKHFTFIKEENIKTTLLGANDKFYPDNNKIIDGKYIFSLCTLGKRKNLIFAIKNFFTFIEKHNIQDLKLVLGGGIWKKYERELTSILNQYDSSKIILTGYIEEDELRRYYSNAMCFIYPSLYEGFGLPVLEAMQCGCPVITSNRTSLPEVIGDCGIKINPESDKEMIEAYEKFYFDPKFCTECSTRGIERAGTFSWGKCTSELLEFIKTNCIEKDE